MNTEELNKKNQLLKEANDKLKNGSVTIASYQKEDDKSSNDEKYSFANQAEEELKLINPEKYDELMDSIRETLEEENKEPGYIRALFENQTNGLIDPYFILSEPDVSNKLNLIME
jgi:hypothetical protein